MDGRWWHVERHEEVTSTNDLALASLRDGQPPGRVVVAHRQTAGRGRRGRTWADHAGGANLAVSATVPGPGDRPGLLTLTAGVAVADALATVGFDARLKWPNDVVQVDADGAVVGKVAGILTEAHDGGAVVGVGLNVDHRGRPPIEGAVDVAGAVGGDVDPEALLDALLVALDRRLGQVERGDGAAVLAEHRSRSATLGREVVAHLGGGPVRGRAVALAADGALVVATTDGSRRTVTSGEVVHLR